MTAYHSKFFTGVCDTTCEAAKKNAQEEVISLVNYMNREVEKEIESNAKDLGELVDLLKGNYDENVAFNPNAWQEAMAVYTEASWKELTGLNPLAMKDELYDKVDKLIGNNQISTSQAEKLKKSIDDSLAFGSSALGSWTDMRVAMENSLALEIAENRRQNDDLEKQLQQ